MINHFRAEIPQPIVGIGHSLGGNQLVNLAFMHPRLLTSLILLDPVIQQHSSDPTGPGVAQLSTYRRDFWPSREEAETAFRKQKYYQSWDSRVLDRWIKYGIRDTPSLLYPSSDGGVTLSTSKHQECASFLRPSWDAYDADGKVLIKRDLVPDLMLSNAITYPFYRPEPLNTLARLGEVRPSVLYIFGGTSPMSPLAWRQHKLETTGSGVGGSGGAKEGRVKEVTLEGIGHLVPMEASERCADAAASWLGGEKKRFEEEKKVYVEWSKKSLVEKHVLSDEWKRRIGGPATPRKSKI